jgi:hypothetical protein
MLIGAESQRLTHLLKTVQKNPRAAQWMKEKDDVHVFIWLHCLSASTDLEQAIGHPALDKLTRLLDLPPVFGSIGLRSLERSTCEEFLGSFAGISASLITFCRSTELPLYIAIAEASERMDEASALQRNDEDDAPPFPFYK